MNKPLAVGLAGYGLGGRQFHAPFIAATPGLRLTHVATSRAGQVAGDGYDATVVPDLDHLLAADLDLIVITTPSGLHAEHAERALSAGRHVVVDKPIAETEAEAAKLAALATRVGRLLVPFHNRRWDADFQTIRHLIDDGALDGLATIESRIERHRPAIQDRWRERPGPGAGLLADLGPHMTDQVLLLFGAPQWVQGDLRRQRPNATVEDAFTITLGWADGRRATCSAASLCAAPGPRFVLHAAAASFVKYGVDDQGDTLVPGVDVTAPDWGREGQEKWGRLTAKDGTVRVVPSRHGNYRAFYLAVAAAVAGTAPTPVPAEDGVRVMRVIDLARRSHEADGRRLAFAP